MAGTAPAGERALDPAAAATPWACATRLLADGDTYWLATVRPDGQPHVRPVLAVWSDGALYFAAGPWTRKGRNLAADTRCVVSVNAQGSTRWRFS